VRERKPLRVNPELRNSEGRTYANSPPAVSRFACDLSKQFGHLTMYSGGAAGPEIDRDGPTSAKVTPNFYKKARSVFLFYKFMACNQLFLNKISRYRLQIRPVLHVYRLHI
jgi:hypothetical protein